MKGYARSPSYDLRAASRADILALVEQHHGYGSLSSSMTYCFAVYEQDKAVAAYAWQPPPYGAAKSLAPSCPGGVLSLSRMVAIQREDRSLRHVSKPLRRQMRYEIDRGRWPVLVTYSDESEGHTGYVYKVSGWVSTIRNLRPIKLDASGARRSSYSNGVHGSRDLVSAGSVWIQRWEHRVCEPGDEARWMALHGWRRVAIPGKVWASGRPAHTWVNEGIP